jgi:hypothetical protein
MASVITERKAIGKKEVLQTNYSFPGGCFAAQPGFGDFHIENDKPGK